MSASMTKRPASARLYDQAAVTARETGVPVSRTATAQPRITAKSFRLPSGWVTVDQRSMEGFTELVADHMGRIGAADRAAVPTKVQEFAQAMLDMHANEIKELQRRVEQKLANEWMAQQAWH